MTTARQHEIFDEFKDRVYSLALRYSNDADRAADLTQEIFLKIFQSFKSFRGESQLATWIYRIAMNTCIDHQRRIARVVELIEDPAACDRSDPEALFKESELQRLIQEAVAELPDGARESIVLRYVNGCSYDEIAEILGCPAGTVAARISRGQQMLRERLSHLRERVR